MPDREVQSALDTLMRGLSVGHPREAAAGYKALFKLGHDAIPGIEKKIFQSQWKDLDYPHQIKLISALVGLIHDIDETRSRAVVDTVVKRGCHPSVESVLNSICRFNLVNYRKYEIRGIDVFESKEIITRSDIKRYLTKWLSNVPEKDLQDVERIFVIEVEANQDYGGYYVPDLFVITLVWNNPYRRWNPMSWVSVFYLEHALYHEIGHHFYRHSGGWRDPDHEKQADSYSLRMHRKIRPVIFRVLKSVVFVLRPILVSIVRMVKTQKPIE